MRTSMRTFVRGCRVDCIAGLTLTLHKADDSTNSSFRASGLGFSAKVVRSVLLALPTVAQLDLRKVSRACRGWNASESCGEVALR
jgi:hypothetical protein